MGLFTRKIKAVSLWAILLYPASGDQEMRLLEVFEESASSL